MTDVRRELSLINKHVRQHNREAGESVVLFQFIAFDTPNGSQYDDVYDEGRPGPGGKKYGEGITLPTVYVEESEDKFTLNDDGRQPTQNLYVTILFEDMQSAGVSSPEEYKQHLNDVLYYDGRYYNVSDYHVRGRLGDEVIVGISGFEIYVDQEMMFDVQLPAPSTQNLPWPATLPTV